MQRYVIRKLLLLPLILLAITFLVFLMRVLVPGDPVDVMFMGQAADPKVQAQIRHELGLDRPLPGQYLAYVSGLLHGDLGRSVRSRQPVTSEIASRYPKTVELAAASLVVSVLVGGVFGIVAAVRRNSLSDVLLTALSVLGMSMPSFWLALLLMNAFGLKLRWFPVMGAATASSIVMPAVSLGLIGAAVIARMVRSSMLEALGHDYIRTALAKGLNRRAVVWRHALKNALLPVITLIGVQFGDLLAGSFIIEVVFAWPGVGRLAVDAIQARDFPLIQGIVLVVATTYVVINALVDLLYAVLDPRVSYE